MRKLICSCFMLGCMVCGVHAKQFTSCGAGYVLVPHASIDGVPAAECQKLWCRDLETGKAMGSGTKVNSGYRTTNAPVELCDAKNNCVTCWGDRKWCSGEVAGEWNPEYGAYTRGGDNGTYKSYQKGGCFAWQLEKPSCPDGQTAILQDDKWVCATAVGNTTNSRASTVRRPGSLRFWAH